MPNDATDLIDQNKLNGSYTITDTELYPKDKFGYRDIPIKIVDVYGRFRGTKIERMNERQYKEWLGKQS